MTERPILFSAPMVRAILTGTKTQTRRALPEGSWLDPELGVVRMCSVMPGVTGFQEVACRYGQPGDRLWVREAWGYFDPDGTGEDYDDEHETPGPGPVAYCDELLQEGHPLRDFWRRRVAYKATFAEDKYGKGPVGPNKWRPSIHMPRWASRITLEITGVRVERLTNISEADALAEGIVQLPDGGYGLPDGSHYHGADPRESYLKLWETINGDDSVAANPLVWVVTFTPTAQSARAGSR